MKLRNNICAALAIFAAIVSRAEARIGWTLAECEQHYGKATSRVSPVDGQTVYDFSVGNIQITAGQHR